MDNRTKLEDKLQYLREEWVFSDPPRRKQIEELAGQIKAQIAGEGIADGRIRSAQDKLAQWAKEYKAKRGY